MAKAIQNWSLVFTCLLIAVSGCAMDVTDEGELAQAEVDSAESALWRGEPVHDTRVAYIEDLCTAVPIGTKNGRVIMLTAAHAVFGKPNPVTFRYHRSDGAGATKWVGTFSTKYTIHPNYNNNATGATLAGYDIALLEIPNMSTSTFSFSPLWAGNVDNNTVLEALGFGNFSNLSDTYGTLRTGYQFGQFRPDAVGLRHFTDSNDGHVSLCKGDSGGPARLTTGTHAVVGIASWSTLSNRCRTDLSSNQHWNKVSAHTGWIELVRGTSCRAVGSTLECW